jgi:hypothetical protein
MALDRFFAAGELDIRSHREPVHHTASVFFVYWEDIST